VVEEFKDDEQNYLLWVTAHPEGFVANLQKKGERPEYPMVHHLSRQCVSSPNRDNYTTGKYYKVCAEKLEELERWCRADFRRPLVKCSKCMK
jgi:hypothetical protein